MARCVMSGPVTLYVTVASANAGKSVPGTELSITINQSVPKWNLADNYDVVYGSTTTIPLNNLVENNQGLVVKFNDGTTENGVWEIAITGQDGTGQNQYVLRQKAGQYAPVGPVTLPPLRATNTTSVSSADVTIPLTVTTNATLNVNWTATVLPAGTYDQEYTDSAGNVGLDLNTYRDANNNPLVTTTTAGGAPVSDIYTFTLGNNAPTGWYIDTDTVPKHSILKNNTITDNVSTVSLPLVVTSTNSGKQVPQNVSIPITQLTPNWTQSAYDYSLTYAGTLSVPLNGLVINNTGLNVTIDPATNPGGVWTIAVTGQDNKGQNQYALQQKANTFAPTGVMHLTLIATNTTSGGSASATFNMTVNVNTNLFINWVNSVNTLPDGVYGTAYTYNGQPGINLNDYNKNTTRLLTTTTDENGTGTPIADNYTFTLMSQGGTGSGTGVPGNGWYIASDGVTLKKNDSIQGQPNNSGQATIDLLATSNGSGKTTAKQKMFSITIPIVAPYWTNNKITGTMKFDTVATSDKFQ